MTTFLPGLSEWGSGAVAISDSGVITGTSSPTLGGPSHAVRWVNGVVEDIHPNWANHHGAGVAVNDAGDIAGWAWQIPGGQQGVVWTGGKTIQLPNFGGGASRAYDINEPGQVVGIAANPSVFEAFLWQSGTMYPLTNLLVSHPGFDWLQNADAINDGGQIIGRAAGGAQSGNYLLLNPVPELGTGIILFALTALAFLRRTNGRK